MSTLAYCWECIKVAVAEKSIHVSSSHVTTVDGTYLCMNHAREKAEIDLGNEKAAQDAILELLVDMEREEKARTEVLPTVPILPRKRFWRKG